MTFQQNLQLLQKHYGPTDQPTDQLTNQPTDQPMDQFMFQPYRDAIATSKNENMPRFRI